MQRKIHISSNLLPPRLASVLNILLKDEAIGGKLLLGASIVALLLVNSPLNAAYESFWHTKLSIGLGNLNLVEDLRHWVNDGLMALFFLVIGLEIKREVVKGQLRHPKLALLPIGAAIGGMLIPALIYVGLNAHSGSLNGWGIPVATDIAFALGVLSLLGSRIPSSLKVFLLTLAVVDDLLAIIIIAVFYTAHINIMALGVSVGIALLLVITRKIWPHSIIPYVLLGFALWLAVKASGVHATIAGALIGFLAPALTHKGTSISERLERSMIPISTFIVIPLFALANAGVALSGFHINSATQPVIVGVILGLVVGKTLGVLGSTWLLTRFKPVKLPDGVHWRHMVGVSMLAGIGFTVSIFITELAFTGNEQNIAAAKVGIIIASVMAAILGALVLTLQRKRPL